MDVIPSPEAEADEGFTLVTYGKKRPAQPASTAPPSKAPCSAAGAPPSATPGTSDSQASQAQTPRREKPSITIMDPAKWQDVAALLCDKQVKFAARQVRDGIKVIFDDAAGHRTVTQLLRERNSSSATKTEAVHFFTFPREEEKVLRVVIRGLPQGIMESNIHEDLKAQNLPIQAVHRMYRGRDKKPLDMVLVILDKTQEGKAIFNIKSVCNLSGLTIEAPHKKGIPGQCHNCQLYGHSARFCHCPSRCVKCAGDHSTADCKRDSSDPTSPKCVLCGGGHTANYRGCPKAPKAAKGPRRPLPSRTAKPPTPPKEKFVPAPPPLVSAWAPLPSIPQASHSASPAPARAPVPARARTQAPSAQPPRASAPTPPAPAQAPTCTPSKGPPAQPPRPSAQAQPSFAEDVRLIYDLFSGVNPEDISKAAAMVRAGAPPIVVWGTFPGLAHLFSPYKPSHG